ncbi:hypothetical protein LIER_27300 [Lithospermum erythrorhizon]|uniref:Uncharacterized protein n=1 Tax=Lithospermum erythrorhizon TaxID=34254 RepID=A0AAV3RFG1_LITER
MENLGSTSSYNVKSYVKIISTCAILHTHMQNEKPDDPLLDELDQDLCSSELLLLRLGSLELQPRSEVGAAAGSPELLLEVAGSFGSLVRVAGLLDLFVEGVTAS